MLVEMLLPDTTGLGLNAVTIAEDTVVLEVTSLYPTSTCPDCATTSTRIHSHYHRQPADLALAGFAVRFELTVRRFFCENATCERQIFTERLPGVLAPYARRTHRLATQQRSLALVLGGEAASLQLVLLGMPTSPDTLLRLIRSAPEPEVETPRVLGVDDWAKRKGQNYGTILIDLENHVPVDLLPERSAEALATWLKAHPGVEIISRDRSNEYIKGATEGAPEALQVADRWHLLKNLREALEALLETKPGCLQAAALPAPPEPSVLPEGTEPDPGSVEPPVPPDSGAPSLGAREAEPDAGGTPTAPGPSDGARLPPERDLGPEPRTEELSAPPANGGGSGPEPEVALPETCPEALPASRTPAERQKEARHARRQVRYDSVRQLHDRGLSQTEIARRMHLDRSTVRRYLQTERCPQYRARPPQVSKLDPFKATIRQRWQEGCHQATQILEEIRQQGYHGGHSLVMEWIAQNLRSHPDPTTEAGAAQGSARSVPQRVEPPEPWSARRASWVLMKSPEELTSAEQHGLAQMQQAEAEVQTAYTLGQRFRAMVRERTPEALQPWLDAVTESGVGTLQRFAKGLQQDFDAVRNALALVWSNGQTEGQVNRLKLIKRQMYGRANFDLLRKRVLAQPLRC